MKIALEIKSAERNKQTAKQTLDLEDYLLMSVSRKIMDVFENKFLLIVIDIFVLLKMY